MNAHKTAPFGALFGGIMAIKKSVRLIDDTIKNLQALSGHEINWSGAINSLSQYHSLFCQYCLPELKQAEKYALAQAYNGHLFGREIEQEVRMLHWKMSEAIEYDGSVFEILASEDIDPSKFLERVKAWTPAQRLAVLVFVQKFWNESKPIVDDGE